TVQDTTAPVLTSTLDAVINVNCDAIPNMPVVTFSDACSSASDITITSTETPSEVSEDGSYTIIRTWTASDSCNNQSTVSQTVNVTISNYFRTIVKDSVCSVNQGLIIDIADEINTQYPGVVSSNGTYTDVSNSGALNESTGEFTPLNLADGDYIIRYENNDPECPRIVEITLKVRRDACTVLDCVTLVVHNAFSPDGDGINENFIIDNITDPCYVENKVEIYNRWGVLVFEVQNYNNVDRVFKGYSNGRTTVNESSGLPAGTYFYVLKYKTIEGNYSSETGHLYLGRSN
ncbi:gliding motility-associated C-terminal domain-containing protein, partial [Flavobacterium aquatile]